MLQSVLDDKSMRYEKLNTKNYSPNSQEGQVLLHTFIEYTLKGFRVDDFPLEAYITSKSIHSKRFKELKRRYKALKSKHKNKF